MSTYTSSLFFVGSMSFGGLFDLNSMPLQEHDLLAAPSDVEFQQVPDAAALALVVLLVVFHMCPVATWLPLQ